MEDLIIPAEVLEQVKITAEDLKIEIATFLYEKERLSIGQARKLAGLDLISFQKELSKRDIYIHYDAEDLISDVETLKRLDKNENG